MRGTTIKHKHLKLDQKKIDYIGLVRPRVRGQMQK